MREKGGREVFSFDIKAYKIGEKTSSFYSLACTSSSCRTPGRACQKLDRGVPGPPGAGRRGTREEEEEELLRIGFVVAGSSASSSSAVAAAAGTAAAAGCSSLLLRGDLPVLRNLPRGPCLQVAKHRKGARARTSFFFFFFQTKNQEKNEEKSLFFFPLVYDHLKRLSQPHRESFFFSRLVRFASIESLPISLIARLSRYVLAHRVTENVG